MKKIFVILIFLVLCNSFSLNINADSNTITGKPLPTDINSTPIDEDMVSYYEALAQSSNLHASIMNTEICPMASNGCISITKLVTVPGITRYKQDGNQSWSSTKMINCGTIGKEGCALTSFTMAYSKYATPINPGQMNSKLGASACPADWTAYGSKNGLIYQNLYHDITGYSTLDQKKNVILGALQSYRPVVIGLYNTANKTTHYVLVVDYIAYSNGTYTFGIMDPSVSVSFNKVTLNDYTNGVWKIDRIKVYYK